MRNLSVMEQKQIVAGKYIFKKYSYKTRKLVGDPIDCGMDWDKAEALFDDCDTGRYHALIIDEYGHILKDSDPY